MPAKPPVKTLDDVVRTVGVYPAEAFLFVRQGLDHTVQKIHGDVTRPDPRHHIGGRELCLGLRDLALDQWGLLARTVLSRWGITRTLDFGQIVFAMIEFDLLQKTDRDSIEDFRNVYDFRAAFETDYRITCTPATGKKSA